MSSPHKKNEKDSGPDNKDLVVRFFSKHNMSDSNFLYLKTALQNLVNIFLRDSGDTQICFTVTNWLVSVAIKRLISFIKEIGVRIAVLRKKKALEKFIKAAEKNGEPEIAKELKRVKDSAGGLLVPVNIESGEENWEDLKVVGAQNEEQDDLVDEFMFADTGRVKAL